MLKKKMMQSACLGAAVALLFTACTGLPASSTNGTEDQVRSIVAPVAASSSSASVSGAAPHSSLEYKKVPGAPTGGWHASDVVGSGYCDRYIFEADGTFYFAANQMTAGERLRYRDGRWTFEGGALTLTVERKIVIEGGEYVDDERAAPYLSVIVGGTYVKYALAPSAYEIIELPVQDMGKDERERSMILIGEMMFWESVGIDMSDIPTMWDADWDRPTS